MKIIQITDCHLKNEEPFFRAGIALDSFIIDQLLAEKEPFVFLDSGDRFHVSKETGRVNAEVIKFFTNIASMINCRSIYVMQGNHDVKDETGSALDVIRSLDSKIQVVDEPYLVARKPGLKPFAFADADMYFYLLPHMKPFLRPGYSGIKSYGDENFHRNYWKAEGADWDEIKNKIKFVSLHGGDETTGKFFMNVDISFLPGIRSNGHVHKQVSKNHLPSAMVTRRDEIDKKCFIRHIDTDNWTIKDVEIPLFLNYAQIPYGEDVESYFKSGVHILPRESLIVDIYGHDDKELVISEYQEKWNQKVRAEGWPMFYIGEVTPAERRGEAVPIEERDDLDISSINIKELFQEFCEEKKLAKAIVDDLMARIE
jgi:DNA repair exonuclease SbcCD nuclease subunit